MIIAKDSYTIPVPQFSLLAGTGLQQQIYIDAECDYELNQIAALSGDDFTPNKRISVMIGDTASGRNIFRDKILLPMLSRYKFEPRIFMAKSMILLDFRCEETENVEKINVMLIGRKIFSIYA